jgi:hypothetical protein
MHGDVQVLVSLIDDKFSHILDDTRTRKIKYKGLESFLSYDFLSKSFVVYGNKYGESIQTNILNLLLTYPIN